MKTFQLRNGQIRAEVGELGAELLSLQAPDGEEQIWSGTPDTWNRRGPIVFPILGGWPKGYYLHNGQQYRMDKNGFARSCRFEARKIGPDGVELLLESNETTNIQYPFPFCLKARYSLADMSLHIQQSVVNTGSEKMPAALGMHPGFRWDRSRGGASLKFSCPQTIRAFHPDGKRYPILKDEDQILLSEALFEQGAISLEHVCSQWVELSRPDSMWNIRLHHTKYPYLTLWSMKCARANFLCIEPSTGVGTDGDSLLDRRGIVEIAPGESLDGEIKIEFVPRRE